MHPLCPAAHCTKSKDGNVMRTLTSLDALLAKREAALSLYSNLLRLLLIQLLKVHNQIPINLTCISSMLQYYRYNIKLTKVLMLLVISISQIFVAPRYNLGTISSHRIPSVIKIADNSKLLSFEIYPTL